MCRASRISKWASRRIQQTALRLQIGPLGSQYFFVHLDKKVPAVGSLSLLRCTGDWAAWGVCGNTICRVPYPSHDKYDKIKKVLIDKSMAGPALPRAELLCVMKFAAATESCRSESEARSIPCFCCWKISYADRTRRGNTTPCMRWESHHTKGS